MGDSFVQSSEQRYGRSVTRESLQSGDAAGKGPTTKELQRRLQDLETGVHQDPEHLKKRLQELGQLAEDAVQRCEQLEQHGKPEGAHEQHHGLKEVSAEHRRDELEQLREENEELENRTQQLEREKRAMEEALRDLKIAQTKAVSEAEASGAARASSKVDTTSIVNRLIFKRKEQHLLKELDEQETREEQLQARNDELIRINELANKQIDMMKNEMAANELQQQSAVGWKWGWHAEMQDERARRRQRHDNHNVQIDHHIDLHLNDCAEDLKQLKRLKQIPGFHKALKGKHGKNLADEINGVPRSCATSFAQSANPSFSQSAATSFAQSRVVSFAPGSGMSSDLEPIPDSSFKAGITSVRASAVDASLGAGLDSTPSSQPASFAGDALGNRKDLKELKTFEAGAGGDVEMATKEEIPMDDEEQEIELHPHLKDLAEDEAQRKLLRALHLIELLQQQNAHLKDDVEHLEEHAAMFAKVERRLVISVVLMGSIITIVCIGLVASAA